MATLGIHPEHSHWLPAERVGFARALGRVVAHEVVHVILGRGGHARRGLMSPSLGRAALLGASIDVDADTRRGVAEAMAVRTARGTAPSEGEGAGQGAPEAMAPRGPTR
jgi:hypothetical protein